MQTKPITEEQVALDKEVKKRIKSFSKGLALSFDPDDSFEIQYLFIGSLLKQFLPNELALARNQALKEVLELVEDEELKPYKGEYTKEIQQDRLNIVKRNELRQKLRASIKKLMEVL